MWHARDGFMLDRRTFIGAVASSVLLAARGARAEAPNRPTWARDSKDPRWVQGQVVAPAAADAVWARLQRVAEWPQMFSDIKAMRILERGPDDYRVKLETRTFNCGAHEYKVHFDPSRSAKLWIDAPGVTALAYMRVLEGVGEGASRVVYSLFLEARGIAAWFHTENDLRAKQESMVVRYLEDLERAFRAPATESAPTVAG